MQMTYTLTLLLSVAILSLTTLSNSAHADEIGFQIADVTHDGRFIYYRTAWSHLSASEQDRVIGLSVQLLKNEISKKNSTIVGLRTLSNCFVSDRVMNKLVT